MEEKALIENCLNGNRLAQKQLFDKYYNKMYYVAMRYLSDKNTTEDVLAEAFNRVFRKLDDFSFKGEGSLGKWIKTIVINESLRMLSQKRKLIYVDDLSVVPTEHFEELDDTFDLDYLLSLVESMPEGYRIVFNLYVFENYSHPEIAEMLTISVSTSKSQLFKARQHLIKQLKLKKVYEVGRN